MKSKTGAEKEFDRVLRGMLTSKPLSKAEISARIQARRRAKQKQASQSKKSRD
jgi:hypothetical protein